MGDQGRSRADVARRVRRRGRSIAEEELAEALARLEARGGLTDGQRRAVEELVEGIAGELLEATAETVASARREEPGPPATGDPLVPGAGTDDGDETVTRGAPEPRDR